jgi:hypothetical protein
MRSSPRKTCTPSRHRTNLEAARPAGIPHQLVKQILSTVQDSICSSHSLKLYLLEASSTTSVAHTARMAAHLLSLTLGGLLALHSRCDTSSGCLLLGWCTPVLGCCCCCCRCCMQHLDGQAPVDSCSNKRCCECEFVSKRLSRKRLHRMAQPGSSCCQQRYDSAC